MKKELTIDRLLAELNNDSLTDRERAEILTQILDIELEKPEAEADMDLIQECFDYLELLNNSDAEIEARKEQLPDLLQRTYQKAAEPESDAALVSEIQPAKRKRRFRKAGIAAAIIAVVLLIAATSLTVIAKVKGYEDPWDMILAHLDELFHGGEMSTNDFTIVFPKENKSYPDMETWLKEDPVDILYPSVLPDGIRVNAIVRCIYGEGDVRHEGDMELRIAFDPKEITFTACNYDLDKVTLDVEDIEVIEINGYHIGILYTPGATMCPYNAHFVVDGFVYTIGAPDRDTLLFVLKNLKKSGS